MHNLVIDASVALAWYFPDENANDALLVLEELRHRNAIVPGHWHLEITNAILMGQRRQRLAAADVSRFLGLLSGLALAVDPFTAQRSLSHIMPLAKANALSAYDAAYLELAMREGLGLATLDRKLGEAAKASGVSVYPQK